jgi:hypothetical protein
MGLQVSLDHVTVRRNDRSPMGWFEASVLQRRWGGHDE